MVVQQMGEDRTRTIADPDAISTILADVPEGAVLFADGASDDPIGSALVMQASYRSWKIIFRPISDTQTATPAPKRRSPAPTEAN